MTDAPSGEGEGALLSPAAIARRVGVDLHTVYAWINSGQLEAIDVGVKPPDARSKRGPWRVSERALEKFLAERSTQ